MMARIKGGAVAGQAQGNAPKGVDPDLYEKIRKTFGKRGYQTELAKRQKAEIASRLASPVILQPEFIASSKEAFDAASVLMTTIGGERRNITQRDIQAFKKNIEIAKKRFVEGIKPQQVINLSTDGDLQRSRDQIKVANLSRKFPKGLCHIVTNAGENSKHSRHIVTVQFTQFEEALGSTGSVDNIARYYLQNGRVKFDCTCERHTFWFRYITTIGGFNAGRPESGFPKETNPNLSGVGCKHVIKVMNEIQSATFRSKLVQWIRESRKNLDTKAQQITAQEMLREAERQLKVAHHKRNLPTRKEEQKIIAAIKKVIPKIDTDYQQSIDNLNSLREKQLLTDREYQRAVKRTKKAYGVA